METCLHSYFIVNDELRSSCDFIPSKFDSEGFIYEVIRVIDGKPLFLNAHLDRFYESFRLKKQSFDYSIQQTKQAVNQIITFNKVTFGNIKLIGHARQSDQEIIFATWFIPHDYPNSALIQKGVKLSFYTYQRTEPNAKIQRNTYKQGVSEALKEKQAYELLLTANNSITEGSRSNVFFVKDNIIYTAASEAVLCGITRNKIIKICTQYQIQLIENEINISSLSNFEAGFITGTSAKVLPICCIDDQVQFNPTHPLVLRLIHLFDAEIEYDLQNFSWT